MTISRIFAFALLFLRAASAAVSSSDSDEYVYAHNAKREFTKLHIHCYTMLALKLGQRPMLTNVYSNFRISTAILEKTLLKAVIPGIMSLTCGIRALVITAQASQRTMLSKQTGLHSSCGNQLKRSDAP